MDILSTGDLGVQYEIVANDSEGCADFSRRGMAAFMGKDVKKLKAKGGGKWKYMYVFQDYGSPIHIEFRVASHVSGGDTLPEMICKLTATYN